MMTIIKIVLRNFLYRRKRTFLTVVGITIGTTLVLTLILLGEGMKHAINQQMQGLGGDLIFVMPGSEDNPFAGLRGGAKLRDKDVRVIEEVRGVEAAIGMGVRDVKVDFLGEEKVVSVSGSPWVETQQIFETSMGLNMARGVWPERDDQNLVVLGSDVAKDRFREPINPGDDIELRSKRFIVAGVFEPIGNPDDDGRVYVSLEQYRRITGETGVFTVMVKLQEGYDAALAAEDIKEQLERQKGTPDFMVFTSDTVMRVVGDILGVIQLVLGAFAAVALIVGGIGIMNTMFTSVLERTREIGTMKALGSTGRNILYLFLAEAGFLGILGGLIGVGISLSFALLIEYGAKAQDLAILDIRFDPVLIVGALVFTFVIGMVFGAVPAWRAARMNPIEALHYE